LSKPTKNPPDHLFNRAHVLSALSELIITAMSFDSSSFLWWFASSGSGRAFRCFGLVKISKHASFALFTHAIALNLLPFKGYLTSAEAAHMEFPWSKYRRR
jgi:hypothetical protein